MILALEVLVLAEQDFYPYPGARAKKDPKKKYGYHFIIMKAGKSAQRIVGRL